MRAWGRPVRNAALSDGRQAYTWVSAEPARCERTLIFDGGRVVEQNWQGAMEYCNGFARATR